MKNKLLIIIAFTFAIIISCGCKKDTSTSIIEQKPQPIESVLSTGIVVVWFADSVAQSRAKEFIHNLSLVIVDSSQYDLHSPHELDLKVPVGQEFKWSDSLKTFPIVVSAYPVFVMNQ